LGVHSQRPERRLLSWGAKSAAYLTLYPTRFDTAEVDSTLYGGPNPEDVASWHAKTAPGLVFSVRVPQFITHQKIPVDCQEEFETFIETMDLPKEELGVILF
jgi:uncharacterized protein YecE (DUF72 family)